MNGKPTVCRMCGETFSPTGDEHICAQCEKEISELELRLSGPKEETNNNEATATDQ